MVATLEFRGLDLQSALTDPDLEGCRFQITKGFLGIPQSRGDDILIPSRVGRDPGNRVADSLSLIVSGRVQARTTATLRSVTDALLAVLDENDVDPGSLIARAPYLGLAPGTMASILARVDNYIEGPILAGNTYQTFNIQLTSLDPYWVVS